MSNLLTKLKNLLAEPLLSFPESDDKDFDELWDSGQPFTQHKTMDSYDDFDFPFHEAMNAPTIEEGIDILYAEERTADQWETLAFVFAFANGDSNIPPSEREEALAAACLDKMEELEGLN